MATLSSGRTGLVLLVLAILGGALALLFLVIREPESCEGPAEPSAVELGKSGRVSESLDAGRRPLDQMATAPRQPLETIAPTAPPRGHEEPIPPGESGERILAGRVVDATRAGESVANATVLLNDPMEPDAAARTGEDGSFKLVLPPGPIGTVLVRADGYGFARWSAWELDLLRRDDAGFLVFPVYPGARLHGRVVDNHGNPLGQGRVVAYDERTWNKLFAPGSIKKRKPVAGELDPLRELDPRSNWLYAMGEPVWLYTNHPFARLEEDGTFALTDLPDGVPLYLAVEAERATRAFHEVFLDQGEDREMTITVRLAPVIRGRATFPGDEGLLYPGVWFCVHEEHVGVVFGADRWVPLGPDGTFSSGPLWPAEEVAVTFTFEIEDHVSGLRYFEKEVVVSLGQEEELELEVDLGDARQAIEIPERVRD